MRQQVYAAVNALLILILRYLETSPVGLVEAGSLHGTVHCLQVRWADDRTQD